MNGVEALKDNSVEFRVTGISVQYYVTCKRELWFYLKGVEIDKDNKNIVKGDFIDKNSYNEKSEVIMIDGMIAPDLLENGDIVEVKPSSKMIERSKMQLVYYLWYMDEFYSIEKDGVLVIPEENKRGKN